MNHSSRLKRWTTCCIFRHFFLQKWRRIFFVLLVVYLLSLKNCEAIGQVKGKRRSGRPKILSTLVKQYLKVKNRKNWHMTWEMSLLKPGELFLSFKEIRKHSVCELNWNHPLTSRKKYKPLITLFYSFIYEWKALCFELTACACAIHTYVTRTVLRNWYRVQTK